MILVSNCRSFVLRKEILKQAPSSKIWCKKSHLNLRFVWIFKATFSTMLMVFNLTAFLATALVVIKAN